MHDLRQKRGGAGAIHHQQPWYDPRCNCWQPRQRQPDKKSARISRSTQEGIPTAANSSSLPGRRAFAPTRFISFSNASWGHGLWLCESNEFVVSSVGKYPIQISTCCPPNRDPYLPGEMPLTRIPTFSWLSSHASIRVRWITAALLHCMKLVFWRFEKSSRKKPHVVGVLTVLWPVLWVRINRLRWSCSDRLTTW